MKMSCRNKYLRILLLITFFSTATYLLSVYSFRTFAQEAPTEPPEEIIDTERPTTPTHIFPPREPVTAVNSENFYVEWEPSEDNVTPPENITYLYIPYKFGLLPILEEPFTYVGTTRHPEQGYDTDFMEGIYWYTVIAIDEAGNPSEPDGGHSTTQFVIDNSPPDKVEDLNIYKGYTSDIESSLGCSKYINNTEFRIQWQKTEDTWNPLEEPPTDYNYLVTHYLITLKPEEVEPDPKQIPEETEEPTEPVPNPWEIKVKENYYDFQEENLIPEQNTYDFLVTAVDKAGNKGEPSEACSITVDANPPTTTISFPQDNHISKNPLLVNGYSTDDYTVDTVDLFYTPYDTEASLCGEEWNNLVTKQILDKETAPFNWSHYDSSLEDGTYCLRAQSKDLAGNIEDTKQLQTITNIMYDATRPVIENINITNNRVLASVSTSDNLSGIKEIQMRIGSIDQWTTYLLGEALDPLVNNEPGTYTLYIKVTDNAGNEEVQSSSFTIPEPPPPPTEEDPVLGASTSTNTSNETNNSETRTISTTTNSEIAQKAEQSTDDPNTDTLGVDEREETLEVDNNPPPIVQNDINTNNYPENTTNGEVKGESTVRNNIILIALLILIPVFAIFFVLLDRKKGKEPQEAF